MRCSLASTSSFDMLKPSSSTARFNVQHAPGKLCTVIDVPVIPWRPLGQVNHLDVRENVVKADLQRCLQYTVVVCSGQESGSASTEHHATYPWKHAEWQSCLRFALFYLLPRLVCKVKLVPVASHFGMGLWSRLNLSTSYLTC